MLGIKRKRNNSATATNVEKGFTVVTKVVKVYHFKYIFAAIVLMVWVHPWATWQWKRPELWELRYLWQVVTETFTRY